MIFCIVIIEIILRPPRVDVFNILKDLHDTMSLTAKFPWPFVSHKLTYGDYSLKPVAAHYLALPIVVITASHQSWTVTGIGESADLRSSNIFSIVALLRFELLLHAK